MDEIAWKLNQTHEITINLLVVLVCIVLPSSEWDAPIVILKVQVRN